MCCSVLQCAAVCCSVLQCVAVCGSVLQCVAVCCSVWQCSAVCYSVLQSHDTTMVRHSYIFAPGNSCLTDLVVVQHSWTCNTLQHTATHCNTLQHTATHCNTEIPDSSLLCEMTHTPLIYMWYPSFSMLRSWKKTMCLMNLRSQEWGIPHVYTPHSHVVSLTQYVAVSQEDHVSHESSLKGMRDTTCELIHPPFTCGNPHSSSSVSVSDCNTLQHTATHCNTLLLSRRPGVSWIFAQRIGVCCSVLQCVAVCCCVLQSVAVCCSVLPCVTECYRVLQCVAVCCRVLHCVAECCSMLQCVAVCCRLSRMSSLVIWSLKCKWKSLLVQDFLPGSYSYSMTCCSEMQCVAVCCSVLQYVAVRCRVMHCAAESRCCIRWLISSLLYEMTDSSHCNTLQYTATHCNTLQHTATHCNTEMPDSSLLCEMTRTPLICTWFTSLICDMTPPSLNPFLAQNVCMLKYVAVCCSVLQCVAVCCRVLKYFEMCCCMCCSILIGVRPSLTCELNHPYVTWLTHTWHD